LKFRLFFAKISRNALTSLFNDAIMRKKRLEKSMAKGDKKMIRTTYSIPEDLLFKVKFQALKEKRSISDLIRFLLERYLKDKGQ
jgi:hypothetical protein